MIALALAIGIAATFYGYTLFNDGPVAFYVLQGALGFLTLGLLAYVYRRDSVIQAVCFWGMFEQFQVAACGWADVQPASWSGMCLELVGPVPYAIAAATAVLLMLRFRREGR